MLSCKAIICVTLMATGGASGCRSSREAPPAQHTVRPIGTTEDLPGSNGDKGADEYAATRRLMVAEQIAARDVTDPLVLQAMRTVPRHEFVPENVRTYAYQDRPLPVGHDQTISQPYVVAAMTELAQIDGKSRVLEVGTGSGYQAAVLAEIADEVYSIEIVEPLAKTAAATLKRLGYDSIHLRTGDGYLGWPEAAPFDAIIVTAAPPVIPAPLKEQLEVGGHLVIPVGQYYQELMVVTKTDEGFDEKTVFPVRFVPMTGKAQRPE